MLLLEQDIFVTMNSEAEEQKQLAWLVGFKAAYLADWPFYDAYMNLASGLPNRPS